MCKEYGAKGDRVFIESVLPKYLEMLSENPHTTICETEANSVIARALHNHSEEELQWIGGKQPICDFVTTLKALKMSRH